MYMWSIYLSRLDEDVQCDAVAIRELCELLKMHLLSIRQTDGRTDGRTDVAHDNNR